VREVFTPAGGVLDADPLPIEPVAGAVADAVRAIVAAGGRRLAFTVSRWGLAGAVTSRSLLAPMLISGPTNTSIP
jgi:hypothetical protein